MFILTRKKLCETCGEEKPLAQFHPDKRSKDLHSTICEACHIKKTRKRKALFQSKYRVEHPEKAKGAIDAWYRNNVQKVKNAVKTWVQANPDKRKEIVKLNRNKRRALKLASGGNITAQEWQALKEFYNYTCPCCKRSEPEIKLTLDHVKPLGKGGSNTIDNAQPLCGFCNSSKGTKEIDYR